MPRAYISRAACTHTKAITAIGRHALTTLTNASVHAMHLGLQPFNHALACLDRGDCTILSDTCQGM